MLVAAIALTLAAPKFPLTIESIMRGPGIVGVAPRNLGWSPDGEWVTFTWAKADGTQNPQQKPWKVRRDGTGLTAGTVEDGPRAVDSGATKGSLVYTKEGDIYLYDAKSKATKQLTQTQETESDPKLVAGGQAVVYSIGPNLYRLTLADMARTQLTDIVSGDAPSISAAAAGIPMAIRVPMGYRARLSSVSPTGDHAWLEFSEVIERGRRADVPRYITSSGYPEAIQTYERVGAPQAHSKGLVLDFRSGKSIEIAPHRSGRMGAFVWSPDGQYAFTVARAEDHKDDWIIGFNAKTDQVSDLWDEHCDAWVGGPARGTVGWYPDGSRIYFASEKSGYENLYSLPAGGGDASPIVTGDFEVSDVRLDATRSRFTFVSSEGSPFIRHLDSVSLDGSNRHQLAVLSADEDADYAIAPDGEHLAVIRSKPNRPAELFVNDVQVTTTPTEEWLSGPWINPPVVMVPSTDGVKVPARLYKPAKWRRGGPAVIFVHGAGYLQNVYDGWSHYFREYMFHHYLMSKGYVVLDMDYRGSAGYGRDWRTAIYRYMGGKDLDDEIAGARWLVEQEGAAKNRLGIYGGSYGGFMTLMAMFTRPGVFAAGAALRPVADWASYNIPYSSEILNLPQDDKVAYQRSSPINFVEGLQGALLICHGMVDTNVTFQDSVRVTERLIELGKKNWEIAPYPVEDHAFTRPASWTDEYTRIFDLFERTIGSGRKR